MCTHALDTTLPSSGVIPRAGWSIDPFGYNPTLAYLLGETGMNNMVIQRVHYAIKKHLSINKALEFGWRQLWGMVKSLVFTLVWNGEEERVGCVMCYPECILSHRC